MSIIIYWCIYFLIIMSYWIMFSWLENMKVFCSVTVPCKLWDNNFYNLNASLHSNFLVYIFPDNYVILDCIFIDLKTLNSSAVLWFHSNCGVIISITWMRPFILKVPSCISHLVSFCYFHFRHIWQLHSQLKF